MATKPPKLNFGDAFSGGTDRECRCMDFLARLVGRDGGPKIDTLEGWCLRLQAKLRAKREPAGKVLARGWACNADSPTGFRICKSRVCIKVPDCQAVEVHAVKGRAGK